MSIGCTQARYIKRVTLRRHQSRFYNENCNKTLIALVHDVDRCIIGGRVDRGKQVPELHGKYLFADYVTGQVYVLTYDDDGKATKVQKFDPTSLISSGNILQ